MVVSTAAIGQGRSCRQRQDHGDRGIGGTRKLGTVVLVRSYRLVLVVAIKVEGR
jgi:hypothetical protein